MAYNVVDCFIVFSEVIHSDLFPLNLYIAKIHYRPLQRNYVYNLSLFLNYELKLKQTRQSCNILITTLYNCQIA